MKRISKSMFRGAIARPTLYVIQTLQDGSDIHARHGTTGDDIIADTQSHIHSRFVCTGTKLVDVVIFFPLISNVRGELLFLDIVHFWTFRVK